ncbi:MAG: hypothetical protein ACE5KA_02565 [Nitrososphaerales archaeon]
MNIVVRARDFSGLILISLILLIITIATTSFYQFPPDGLYYASSLPVFYWAGVLVTLFSVLISYKTKTNDHFKLIPHLILAAYLFSLPAFTYDVPRFVDIYDHGSGALSIFKSGEINPNHSYSNDYPLSFMLMAMNLLVTGIDPNLYFRFHQAFVPLLLIPLIYLLARSFKPRYALYAPLAFNAMLFSDPGHFSPQSLAAPLYLLLWVYLVKVLLSRDSNREGIIVAIIALIAINLSNPTTAYFLLMNLIFIPLIGFALFKLISRKPLSLTALGDKGGNSTSVRYADKNQGANVMKKIIPIMLLHVVVLLAWSLYGAEDRGMQKIIDRLSVNSEIYLQGTTALPVSPASSYLIPIGINAVAAAFMVISTLLFFAILYKHQKSEHKMLIIISGLIAGSMIVFPIFVFQSGAFVLRALMFAAIPWSILFASFMAIRIKNKLHARTRTVALVLVLIFIVLIPISKYGSEPTTNLSSSDIYLADFATNHSSNEWVLTLLSGNYAYRYYGIYNDNEIRKSEIGSRKIIDQEVIEKELDSKIERNAVVGRNLKVALTSMESNVYSLKYPSDYQGLVDSLQKRFNLIANNGSQIYAVR